MISLPDDLVPRLDERARSLGTTRSGLLRKLAERELETDEADRRRLVAELLDASAPRGGRSVEHIRELRRTR